MNFMKNLMLTTAILAAMTGPALAQDAAMPMFRGEADPMDLRASEFIGMRVYTSETAIDADEYAGAQDNWIDVGEINDLIVARDGAILAVLVDIGGFLGMGERQVAVDMSAIKFVSDGATGDMPNDFFLVMNAAKTDFEAAPPYAMGGDMGTLTETATGTAATDMAAGTTATDTTTGTAATDLAAGTAATDMTTGTAITDTAATDTAATADPAVPADGTVANTAEGTMPAEGTVAADTAMPTDGTIATDAPLTRKPIVRDGYTAAEGDYLTTEKLTGARVYDANDDWIGDVGTLIMTDAGQITEAVIDVGGFLGMGEKPVALKLADIDILRNAAGDDLRVYVSMTKEQLEQMPTYGG